MANPPPPGIYVPVPTFFVSRKTADYKPVTAPVDVKTQIAHSLYLARAGVRGLVILGSTGEAVHLSGSERRAILSGVRKALNDEGLRDYPIMVGTTSAQNTVDVLELLKEAKDAGADYGLVLVPGYNATVVDQDGINAWFQEIAGQSPLPILVYHYPGVSNNVKLSPATMAVLAQHPNIVGCKLSHGDVSHLAQIALHPSIDHAKFRVYTGLGQQLLPVVSVGCDGAIDGLAGFFPKSVVRLFELSSKAQPSAHELEERRQLQYLVSAAEELVVQFGIPGIKEAISRLRGFGDVDGTRPPLKRGMPEGQWGKWKHAIDALEKTEASL